MNKLILFIAFLLAFGFSSCQNAFQKLSQPANGFTIAFYNVENLFDTINDPTINDEEYLPESKVAWNTERYMNKLDNLGKVIAAMDTLDFPHVLGLSEVENEAVLKDLIQNSHVKKANYKIVHIEGSDPRGIEVAMIYRPEFFNPFHKQALNFSLNNGREQRHILYVKGTIASGDTLHVFVNHWTSRFGGKEETIPARTGTAAFLRTVVDSLFAVNPNSKIIIGGDFNDNPDDPSMFSFLKAYAPNDEIRPLSLYNLAMEPYLLGEGTLYYQGWDFFDQVVVSSALLAPFDGNLKSGPIEVIKKDWMLFQPRDGEARPNRTASGGRYYGGFSDHLPVLIRLK
jgi:hypothetical protein